MPEKILFNTDGSDTANRIADKTIVLQKGWNCKVVAFHSIKHSINYITSGSSYTTISIIN